MAERALPGTHQVEMLVATTRKPTKPAEMFSGDRGERLEFADIVVSIPPVHQPGKVEWPRQIPGNPATDFVTLQPTRPNPIHERQEALAVFRRLLRANPKKHVLVFVHGYNNLFEYVVFRFAQFVYDSKAVVVPVLFSWPSKGSPFPRGYAYDRESVEYSRDELEWGLRFLAKDPAVGQISILAHSMGNWVTLEALRQMAIRDGKVAGKIQTVVLADPDVGVRLAYKQIDQIKPRSARRPEFILVTSTDDKALAISGTLWSEQRLGSIDPHQEPERSNLKREGIDAWDVTRWKSLDPLGHNPFANPQLEAVIGQVLTPGQILTERVSLGENILKTTAGLTASVGQAANVVVSTPLALVDPDTREHYGDQIGAVGQSLQDAVTPQ